MWTLVENLQEEMMQIDYHLFHIDDLLDTFETYVRGIYQADELGELDRADRLVKELNRVRAELRIRCGW